MKWIGLIRRVPAVSLTIPIRIVAIGFTNVTAFTLHSSCLLLGAKLEESWLIWIH